MILKRSFLLSALWLFFALSALGTSERVVLPKNVTPLHYKIFVAPDAQKMTFEGEVTIDIKVNEPTKSVVLNAADLMVTKARIAGVGEAQIEYDSKVQTATLIFSQGLKPQKYALTISYAGKIFTSANGLFAMDYGTPQAPKRALYTQFEAADARRFMPCFDEPGLKATFELSALVPDSLMAVSNTPATESKPQSNHMKLVSFAKTPLMSTYLLFFGYGDFERISKMVNGVDIGIVVKRGDTAKAAYALETATKILPYYEEYFGVRFPLPKLDLIAMPGLSQVFSAMENWGAITYMDRRILVDPAITTEEDRRLVFLVIAHEMAHQWFGDLVTMAWWDDLWLNEGFAEWMDINTMAHFHPEWRPWLGAVSENQNAMRTDAKAGTHPIVQTILDAFQADQAFDGITYQKGSVVIRMIENYLGADTFRAGIRAYMKKHAYHNTVSDDLWKEIDAASPKPISAIAHDFTRKAGLPLIRVSQVSSGWRIEQGVFSFDDSTPQTQSWRVPIDATKIGDKTIFRATVSRDKPLEVKDPNHVGIFVNSGLSGYYRVLYDNPSFDKLMASFEKLPVEVQVGLVDYSRELGLAGLVPMSRFLSISKRMIPSFDHFVLTRIIDGLKSIHSLYQGLHSQKELENFIVTMVHPVIANIGWTAQERDTPSTPELRAHALELLGLAQDKDIIQKALGYFDGYLKDQKSLSSELRASVLTIVAHSADAERFEQLHKLALSTASVVEKGEYYELVSVCRDPVLVQKALSLALDNTTPATLRPEIITLVARQFPGVAFNFATRNWDAVKVGVEPGSWPRYLPKLLTTESDRAFISRLEEFAQKNFPGSAMQETEKTKAAIKLNADIREKRIPEVNAWLKNFH